MKSLIIYDSNYGNSEKVARAIASAIPGANAVKTFEMHPSQLTQLDLLIIGSPTNGGRPTENLQKLLNNLPANAIDGKLVAAFDTRFALQEHGFGLKMVMKTVGFAAEKIADSLREKGGIEITKPEGFIVEGNEGPLKSGELERAKAWAHKVLLATRN